VKMEGAASALTSATASTAGMGQIVRSPCVRVHADSVDCV